MNENSSNESSGTEWDRVDAMNDADVDTDEVGPLGVGFFRRAALWPAGEPVTMTLHLDPDVVGWFRQGGGHFERRINAALRVYMEAHRSSGL